MSRIQFEFQNKILKANLFKIGLRINDDGFNSIKNMFQRNNQVYTHSNIPPLSNIDAVEKLNQIYLMRISNIEKALARSKVQN